MKNFGTISKSFHRPYNGLYGGGGGAYRTYTIVRQEVSDPSQFFIRYEDDAVGMTQGSTDFDTFFGYSAVLLDGSGNEVEEVVQSSPGTLDMNSFQGALTGTANNVMIKFPRRGIKMSKSGDQVSLSITDDPDKAGFQYYAFTKGSTAKDYLYLGAYKGTYSDDNQTISSSFNKNTTILKSRATLTRKAYYSPATNELRYRLRTATERNGTGYTMITLYPRRYIACLYMMKYGNPDSQSVIGLGYTSTSRSKEPGTTNSQTSATYGTTRATTQMKLFGLEDRRGNCNDMLDCCLFLSDKSLSVDKTNSVFIDSGSYATNLGIAENGYMAGIDGSIDGMFRNIDTTGGSGTTYYSDYSASITGGVVIAGGQQNQGDAAGVFFINGQDIYTQVGFTGTRLQYL